MAKVIPALLCLLILALTAIACAPAAPAGGDDPVQSRLQRRQSAAAPASTFATPVPVVDPSNCARFPDIADRQREHDAIQWQLCPVIENGILRAAGTTTGYRVHGGGRNFPTFVIQYRDTDNPFLVIRRRYPEGYRPRAAYGYAVNQSGRVVGVVPAYKSTSRSVTATDWEVRPQFFSIEARVGKPNEPVDLWVWGSDAPKAYENSLQGRRHRGLRGWVLPAGRGEFNTKPLAIRSIGYIEPAATSGPSSGPSATIPTPTAPPTMPSKPTRLPTVTPWAPPLTPTAEPWLTFSPRHYYSLQLPEGDWKKGWMNAPGRMGRLPTGSATNFPPKSRR